ncbi:MAG: phosphoribosylanthranilate isomerase [Candidatus Cloacimonetes bacterium]|jgi:phosphoribosylanthranilate isomerase|nr:phosphoribosylanthranilate isomerase [Candidatus Cloacimonadota bacterium]MBT5420473.1 phosphoribosylanthranilate isomerase [Candidatus Cloacimonadota bacterium]
MEKTINPRIKICCISSIEEAKIAIKMGASALGLVSEMPSGPGVVSMDTIKLIAASIPPPIATFLLTSKQSVNEIVEQHKICKTSTIQICDTLTIGTHRDLKNALPGIAIVQVIHVNGDESINDALAIQKDVDAILLDSGNQSKQIKELGGTGRIHNWEISCKIREQLDVPIFLAGGINPDNIVEAVNQVNPFGIDLCSGVRTDGKLDEIKLQKLFSNIIRG